MNNGNESQSDGKNTDNDIFTACPQSRQCLHIKYNYVFSIRLRREVFRHPIALNCVRALD